jgi:hypothetical protein
MIVIMTMIVAKEYHVACNYVLRIIIQVEVDLQNLVCVPEPPEKSLRFPSLYFTLNFRSTDEFIGYDIEQRISK